MLRALHYSKIFYSHLTAFLLSFRPVKAVWNAFSYLISTPVYLQGAGVAFFGFISLFPALAVAFILFGLIIDQNLINHLMTYAEPLLPAGPETLLKQQLVGLSERPSSNLSLKLIVSIMFAIWSGTRGMNAFIIALTKAYQRPETRGLFKRLFVSALLTFGGFFIVIAALLSIAVLPVILNFLPFTTDTSDLVLWIRWPIISSVVFIATFFLYWLAPDRQGNSIGMSWWGLIPGAILANLFWFCSSYLFSFYVENFASYDVIFGPIATVIVLLLWIYYSNHDFHIRRVF